MSRDEDLREGVPDDAEVPASSGTLSPAQGALRQDQDRLRLMIGSVRDYAIYMLNTSGRVVTWNSGAERIKGYSESEIRGAHFSIFFTPEDQASGKPQRELELAARDGSYEDEAWRVRKDGSRFWANVVISAVRDGSGELVGFTKVTRDLTERRRTEEERVRLAHAQEALRLRDEFLSIASHELKTPLTALQLQVESVLDRLQVSDALLASKLGKALGASRRLGELIETLLDVSRIATAGISLKTESFDLVAAARAVIERVADRAASAGCELSLSAPPSIVGVWDRLRVEQVLSNLLLNAIKYAAGAPISVALEADAGCVWIRVRDQGRGFRNGDAPRLFGRFERGGSLSQGGMGLGLYVAQQVAEAHGGEIGAANQVGGGACFTVRLPLLPARPARSALAASSAG